MLTPKPSQVLQLSLLAATLTSLALIPIHRSAVRSPAQSSVADRGIITAQDVRFCGGTPQHANLHPHDLADDGSVWRVGNRRWDEDWEVKFGHWVRTSVDKDFFMRFQIPTDCADAALAVRAIFARIHHLPTLFLGGQYSHTSTQWANLPTVKNWHEGNWENALRNDRRFRAALNHWMVGVGTVNLQADTYQIRVRNENDTTRLSVYVRPGTVLLSGGHARFVSNIDTLRWNPIEQLSSTIPAQLRTLSQADLDLSQYPAQMSTPERPDRGILNWNWVVNCQGTFKHVPDHKMPAYSDEQKRLHLIYGLDFNVLLQTLARSPSVKLQKTQIDHLIRGLRHRILSRRHFVESGYEAALASPAEIRNTRGSLYEIHSTPGRDRAILDSARQLFDLVEKKGYEAGVDRSYLIRELIGSDQILLGKGPKKITHYHFVLALLDGKTSPEPWDSLEDRWGFATLKKRRAEVERAYHHEYQAFQKVESAVMPEIRQFETEIQSHKDKMKWNARFAMIPVMPFRSTFYEWIGENTQNIRIAEKKLADARGQIREAQAKLEIFQLELRALDQSESKTHR